MELEFKHSNEYMTIDEGDFVDSYIEFCEDHYFLDRKNEEHQKAFVDDFYSGLDDSFYHCDNREEIKAKLLSILTNSKIIKNIKIIVLDD